MATESYVDQLKRFNNDLDKCREMLLTTELRYYNFNQYQDEEAKERKTYRIRTEGNGNGLSVEVMQAAAETIEALKKSWITNQIEELKTKEIVNVKKEARGEFRRARETQTTLSKFIEKKVQEYLKNKEPELWQRAENEWNKIYEDDDEKKTADDEVNQ